MLIQKGELPEIYPEDVPSAPETVASTTGPPMTTAMRDLDIDGGEVVDAAAGAADEAAATATPAAEATQIDGGESSRDAEGPRHVEGGGNAEGTSSSRSSSITPSGDASEGPIAPEAQPGATSLLSSSPLLPPSTTQIEEAAVPAEADDATAEGNVGKGSEDSGEEQSQEQSQEQGQQGKQDEREREEAARFQLAADNARLSKELAAARAQLAKLSEEPRKRTSDAFPPPPSPTVVVQGGTEGVAQARAAEAEVGASEPEPELKAAATSLDAPPTTTIAVIPVRRTLAEIDSEDIATGIIAENTEIATTTYGGGGGGGPGSAGAAGPERSRRSYSDVVLRSTPSSGATDAAAAASNVGGALPGGRGSGTTTTTMTTATGSRRGSGSSSSSKEATQNQLAAYRAGLSMLVKLADQLATSAAIAASSAANDGGENATVSVSAGVVDGGNGRSDAGGVVVAPVDPITPTRADLEVSPPAATTASRRRALVQPDRETSAAIPPPLPIVEGVGASEEVAAASAAGKSETRGAVVSVPSLSCVASGVTIEATVEAAEAIRSREGAEERGSAVIDTASPPTRSEDDDETERICPPSSADVVVGSAVPAAAEEADGIVGQEQSDAAVVLTGPPDEVRDDNVESASPEEADARERREASSMVEEGGKEEDPAERVAEPPEGRVVEHGEGEDESVTGKLGIDQMDDDEERPASAAAKSAIEEEPTGADTIPGGADTAVADTAVADAAAADTDVADTAAIADTPANQRQQQIVVDAAASEAVPEAGIRVGNVGMKELTAARSGSRGVEKIKRAAEHVASHLRRSHVSYTLYAGLPFVHVEPGR